MTSISTSGPSVMARQKSHRAASSARPGSRSARTAGLAAGIESLLRASRATSGGETSTSSGLRGSSTARTVTTRRFSDFPSLEASLESVIAASAFRRSCATAAYQARVLKNDPIEVVMARAAVRTSIGSAGERTRTSKGVSPPGPKPGASASSATPARTELAPTRRRRLNTRASG